MGLVVKIDTDPLQIVGELREVIGRIDPDLPLADMQTMVEISRMLVYRYASRLDRGLASTRDAAILKLYACEAYKQVADALRPHARVPAVSEVLQRADAQLRGF